MALHTIIVDTNGSGEATDYTENQVHGRIEVIQIDYAAGLDAGTDVVLSEAEGMQRTLLTRSNTATDGVFYPQVQATDANGSAIADTYQPLFVRGTRIKAVVTGSTADTANAITIRIATSD